MTKSTPKLHTSEEFSSAKCGVSRFCLQLIGTAAFANLNANLGEELVGPRQILLQLLVVIDPAVRQ